MTPEEVIPKGYDEEERYFHEQDAELLKKKRTELNAARKAHEHGVGSISLSVPNVPSIVGTSVYAQALLLQDPFSRRLTNVTADVVIQF